MIYEITILGRVDNEAGLRERVGEVLREDMTSQVPSLIAKIFKGLNLKVVKHEDDGVKRLAYDIEGEAFADYDYYEIETDSDDFARAIDILLNGMPCVLRHLVVKQYTREELNEYE